MSSRQMDFQQFAVRILKNHIQLDRVAHAYLFSGNQVEGRRELAMDFAVSLLCLQNQSFIDCACEVCRKIRQGQHPDVFLIGSDLETRSIKIADIRELLEQASLKPYEGKRKIFIVLEADRLTQDAANAFLKTLEEPPLDTLFILCVESKNALLETIQSRCFEIKLKPQPSRIESGLETLWESGSAKNWIDSLDDWSDKSKPALIENLTRIADAVRAKIESENHEMNLYAALHALDAIFEAQDALDANVNQKLVISWLEMKLEKTMPIEVLA